MPDLSFRHPAHEGQGLTVMLEGDLEFGGMERIVTAVADRWPKASLVAPHFRDDPRPHLFPDARGVELPGRPHRYLAPLHAERLRRRAHLGGDLVLALHSSGWALGPRADPGVPVVAYTNGQPRWSTTVAPQYLRDQPWPVRRAVLAALPLMRIDQQRLRRRADRLLACSRFAAATLPEPAQILYPPVAVDLFQGRGDPDGHLLAIGRLVPQKRFGRLIDAARGCGRRLIVVGVGPELDGLRRVAPPNVSFAGAVSDDELNDLLGGSRALVHPTVEEFGIVMAEALAAGVPVISLRAGGALEIVQDGRTGCLVDELNSHTLRHALDGLVHDPDACRASVERFATGRFLHELAAVLDGATAWSGPADPDPADADQAMSIA